MLNLLVTAILLLITVVCVEYHKVQFFGPLIFLLYINDLNNVFKVIDLVFFADDSNLHWNNL